MHYGRDFGEFGLENETRDLERFYESVRMRARVALTTVRPANGC